MSDERVPAHYLVAGLQPPADAGDEGWRQRALTAWCEQAAEHGYEPRDVTGAHDAPEHERWVGVVEVGDATIRLEVRDGGRKVVAGQLL